MPAMIMWPVSQRARIASKSCGIGLGIQVARTSLAGLTITNQVTSETA
jgi:hypothetical protein